MQENITLPVLPQQPIGVEVRHIPNRDGYAANTDGNIWSCRKVGRFTGYGPWKKLTPIPVKGGYLAVKVNGNKRRLIHRLVLETFVGPCPEGMEGCHGKGGNKDNRLENIRWDTPANNSADREAHGNTARGERAGRAKLSDEIVAEIIAEYIPHSRSCGTRALARKYGVAHGTVSCVVTGRSWIRPPLEPLVSSE